MRRRTHDPLERVRAFMAFACPPDCGHCCSHLERAPEPGDGEFRAILREQGIYHCADGARSGLALSGAEADALRARAKDRGMKLALHPRTYLLETRRRMAVVLDWHMPDASCPFLVELRCTAYEARPLVCRAFPVITLGRGSAGLAKDCPKMPVARTQLRAETRARRAIEQAHAALDEAGWALLSAPGARYAKGLTAREAAARLKRYRVVSPEGSASRARATPSTR